MIIVALAIVRVRNLFAAVMLTGIFSLLSAVLFVLLDAVDVAFTEAAVGAGIATLLFVSALAMTTSGPERTDEEQLKHKSRIMPLLIVFATGAVLIWGTLDMPNYGDPNAPAAQHVMPRYINESGKEVGLPNVVTSVLASYRGYDTLGEVFVIFTAGLGVLVLLGLGAGHRDRDRGANRWRPGMVPHKPGQPYVPPRRREQENAEGEGAGDGDA